MLFLTALKRLMLNQQKRTPKGIESTNETTKISTVVSKPCNSFKVTCTNPFYLKYAIEAKTV